MARLTFLLMLVVVGAAFAADQACTVTDDCDCGSVCTNSKCESGCMVYDKFVKAGAEAEIYGRMCECDLSIDAHGRAIMCAEDVKFHGYPHGVKMYKENNRCTSAPLVPNVEAATLPAEVPVEAATLPAEVPVEAATLSAEVPVAEVPAEAVTLPAEVDPVPADLTKPVEETAKPLV